MSDLVSSIVIGSVTDGRVVVKMRGPLAEYVKGLCRQIACAPEVRQAFVVDGEPIVIVTFNDSETPGRARICVRNRCRDWVAIVTGVLSDTSPEGDRVHLVEKVQSAAA